MRIYLIGYMASGKSWLGRELAGATRYSFTDMDELFEAKYRISIPDFFSRYGEPLFREFERDLLRSTDSLQDTFISTGGGTPCYVDNMAFIRESGVSIYLRMRVEDLVHRILALKKKRPLLKSVPLNELESFIRRQLTEREKFYRQADHIFDGPAYVVPDICRTLQLDS